MQAAWRPKLVLIVFSLLFWFIFLFFSLVSFNWLPKMSIYKYICMLSLYYTYVCFPPILHSITYQLLTNKTPPLLCNQNGFFPCILWKTNGWLCRIDKQHQLFLLANNNIRFFVAKNLTVGFMKHFTRGGFSTIIRKDMGPLPTTPLIL